jgi:enoyl-CoA hydratase
MAASACSPCPCADHRIMTEGEARTGLTEIQVGVSFPTSALEAVRVSCAGPHLSELVYRGQTYPPQEALVRRLADQLVPADRLLGEALALAEELGGRSAEAFRRTKRALRAEAVARMAAARAGGRDEAWSVWRSPETRAAVEAYRARLQRR